MDSSIMLQKSFTLASLQFYFRIITFFINLYVVRFLGKDILGLVNVRLMLLYTTIVFISREPFRKVCLGLATDKAMNKVINLTWLIVPISIAISAFFSVIWSQVFSVPNYTEYKMVVLMFAMAAVIELASEPLWLFGQMNLLVKLRVLIEASALLSRTILSALLYALWPSLGLYAFAIAQLVYALVVTGSYLIYFYWFFSRSSNQRSLPGNSITTYRQLFPFQSKFEIEALQLDMIKGFVLNCVMKQALTEGERYLMTASDWVSLEMQGEFDIISNLGSLAPRLVFSSIEDSCHLAFSKMLRQGSDGRGQDKINLDQSYHMLTITLKIVMILGVTIVVFAQAYSWPLIVIYAGHNMATNGAPLLRVFALYVVVCALNGVTECFYYSVLSQQELKTHTLRMVAFSLIFLVCGASFVCVLGTVGIIWANCLNMSLRIFISGRFMRHFFRGTEYSLWSVLSHSCPHRAVLLGYAFSLFVTIFSLNIFDHSLLGQLCHILVGLVTFSLLLVLLLVKEASLLSFLRERFRPAKTKTT